MAVAALSSVALGAAPAAAAAEDTRLGKFVTYVFVACGGFVDLGDIGEIHMVTDAVGIPEVEPNVWFEEKADIAIVVEREDPNDTVCAVYMSGADAKRAVQTFDDFVAASDGTIAPAEVSVTPGTPVPLAVYTFETEGGETGMIVLWEDVDVAGKLIVKVQRRLGTDMVS